MASTLKARPAGEEFLARWKETGEVFRCQEIGSSVRYIAENGERFDPLPKAQFWMWFEAADDSALRRSDMSGENREAPIKGLRVDLLPHSAVSVHAYSLSHGVRGAQENEPQAQTQQASTVGSDNSRKQGGVIGQETGCD